MRTVLLLTISNIFMTTAWYAHLRHTSAALWKVIIVSWLIAGVEYCFAVPANRVGYLEGFNAYQLKIIQELITLVVFCVFALTYLGEPMKWNYFVGFGLLLLAVFVMFHKW
jgi:uncharacterized protein (DUF486 family)